MTLVSLIKFMLSIVYFIPFQKQRRGVGVGGITLCGEQHRESVNFSDMHIDYILCIIF